MDEQLYMMGMGLSLEEKIEKAVQTMKHYEQFALKLDPENGYRVAFSGGKDSVVLKRICEMSGTKCDYHYNVTTIDPPELVLFIKREHPDVVFDRPEHNFFTRLKTAKGPPTRMIRWCCEEYKERSGSGLMKVLGIRAAESARRKANWQVLVNNRRMGQILNPILYWSDENVWQFIHEQKIPYCCLYDEGFHRLGCIGCPMARGGREREFARWPQYGKLWHDAVVEYWKRTHAEINSRGKQYFTRHFKCGEDYWLWWLSDEPSAKSDDCQMGLW